MKETPSDSLQPVHEHYDAAAEYYHVQYERSTLKDVLKSYPANYFRLQLLLNSFVRKDIKKVVEVGVGEGTPLATLAKAGIETWGFDFSEPMVKRSKEQMRMAGLDEKRISWGDIEDPITYAALLREGPFDGLVAMGVMPHVANDDAVLENMASLVKPGGSVFIEFRNKLFSLFTMNRNTYDFILDDLLRDVSSELKKDIAKELQTRLKMDMPFVRQKELHADAPGFDAILSKFHNPFEVVDLFKRHGFQDIQHLWYHYHPTLPWLEQNNPEGFRSEAVKLEHEASNWRGMFLCSAFVIEAVKNPA